MIDITIINITSSGVLFSVSWLPLLFPNHPAYIDAGTGSLIIQVLIAGLLGGLFLLKIFWSKVKAFFKKLFSRARSNND